ncbi:hypothetical protein [Paraliomyxa miuraensis]|uniref:hypothetical protein n=1 Tax=Paraliomyxa miuraensis TaxID=376150 RepID=UPI002258D3DD|nr:hypothetical protein [Paraliomyxa miuraensis]MCX4242341.1 hypothetical protein [Paraliomyxa miuraensis]
MAWAIPGSASAAPGQGLRLGGIEPQGPASRAVTAIHHNPAMLAAIPGTAVHASFSTGIEQQRIRRSAIDPATGEPLSELRTPTSLAHLGLGYFVGASLYFEPIAVGVGVYDLGSRYRLTSAEPLRYHLAPDPDPGCVGPGLSRCPPNGGSVESRHDITTALAWNGGRVKLGAALHLPLVRERFAFDDDTALASLDPDASTAGCTDKEDPACTERVGFKGWTQWIPRDGAPSGFDFALTVGAAIGLNNDTITLGARYRSPPLRRGGEVLLGGVGVVCRPEAEVGPEGDLGDQVPPCEVADPVGATLRQRLPQQVALGGSFLLGRSRTWRLDLDLYWMDLCPGGLRATRCPTGGSQTLRLIGLDRGSATLPELSRFRGKADLYGFDAFARYRVQTNLFVLAAAHLASPAVRRGATTAADDEGWRIGTSLGARVRIPKVDLVLVPGYGFDMLLPRTVGPDDALFSPADATAFVNGSGDINAPGAAGVLDGRGRPSNAGRYFGMLHTVSLAVMWGEREVLD